jgi:hypothetical protein
LKIDKKARAAIIIFAEGVIVYFITSYFIIGPLFREFYVSQPVVGQLPYITAYISVGIAAAFTSIALVVYPALKFRESGEEVGQ